MTQKRNRLIVLALLALLIFASLVPAFAQDLEAPTPSGEMSVQPVDAPAAVTQEAAATQVVPGSDSPVVINVEAPPVQTSTQTPVDGDFLDKLLSDRTVFILAVIAFMALHVFTQGKSTALLARYVDPELALRITTIQEKAFTTGLEAGLNISRLTPGLEDDAAWIERARRLGYDVQEENGRYVVKRANLASPQQRTLIQEGAPA